MMISQISYGLKFGSDIIKNYMNLIILGRIIVESCWIVRYPNISLKSKYLFCTGFNTKASMDFTKNGDYGIKFKFEKQFTSNLQAIYKY